MKDSQHAFYYTKIYKLQTWKLNINNDNLIANKTTDPNKKITKLILFLI